MSKSTSTVSISCARHGFTVQTGLCVWHMYLLAAHNVSAGSAPSIKACAWCHLVCCSYTCLWWLCWVGPCQSWSHPVVMAQCLDLVHSCHAVPAVHPSPATLVLKLQLKRQTPLLKLLSSCYSRCRLSVLRMLVLINRHVAAVHLAAHMCV